MKKIICRSLICFFTFLIILCAILFSGVAIINYGPSPRVRNLFVNSMLETSAAKFLATWFFSEEELAEIVKKNSVEESDEVTNPDMISFDSNTDSEVTTVSEKQEVPSSVVVDKTEAEEKAPNKTDGIELIDISTPLYKGKLLIIDDPNRVTVGISGDFGKGNSGKKVDEIAARYGAVAAINGGGFEDENGLGSGAEPLGLVISEGKLIWGSLEGETYQVIGFTENRVLVVGRMTGQEALDAGITDALSFGPALIINGKKAIIYGNGSGMNPRSAVGQRADGAILLLVIDGRQASSLGATLLDVADILYDYGAINAGNLDGGNSSAMYYNGEIINSLAGFSLRAIPTAIVVK